MASTNKTANYDLSQFTGTDKPAWLTDYNQDMNKIDTGIKTAQDTGTSANGKAEANATNIGELNTLTTGNKTSLVNSINEVNDNAGSGISLGNQALNKANANEQAIENLNSEINKFNLTTFRTPNVVGSGFDVASNEIKSATNADGSVGKLYGAIYGTVTSTSSNITISDTGFRPAQDITVDGVCFRQNTSQNNFVLNILAITIKTDGTVTLASNMSATWNGRYIGLLFPACMIFAKDFGDQPTSV